MDETKELIIVETVEETTINVTDEKLTQLPQKVPPEDHSDGKSEYESVGSTESLHENKADDSKHSEEDDGDNDHYDSEDSVVVLEREEGDGQESAPNKKVDDDEDKKNPQYIPKRGKFYEHDDRTLDEEEKAEEEEKVEKTTKKNIWMEKKERWGHDKFNDNEQAPKSRSELISIYGYDIRNEDGPPRARRRRRYGRGPNKYTRNWEDEDAYRPPKPVKPERKPKKDQDQEDFPPLGEGESKDETNAVEDKKDSESTHTSSSSNVASSPINEPPLSPPPPPPKKEAIIERSQVKYGPSDKGLQRFPQSRPGTGRTLRNKADTRPELKDTDYKGFTKTRHFRNSKADQPVTPQASMQEDKHIYIQNRINRISKVGLEKDMGKLNIQDGGGRNNAKPLNQRQGSVPPRLQAEQKGSKRYSSMRQRSLPDTAAPAFNPPNTYYTNDYQPSQSPPMMQPPTIHGGGGGAPVPQIPPPPLAPLPQPLPVTATAIAPYPAPFPQAPPTFLPPNVPTPPFMPQQAPPPLINYVQGQPPPPMMAQPTYPAFQHQPFNAVQNPAGELYQCQGGTTYYSTQSQQVAQRCAPLKRPKAAIPILPPPPQESRGRGRADRERESPSLDVAVMHNVGNVQDYDDAIVAVEQ